MWDTFSILYKFYGIKVLIQQKIKKLKLEGKMVWKINFHYGGVGEPQVVVQLKPTIDGCSNATSGGQICHLRQNGCQKSN